MPWRSYWAIARRRWWIILAIVFLDALVSGYLYHKSARQAGFQACFTLYVADVSSPSLISAPPTSLAAEGQLLAGETAANFFADDVLDVAQSSAVARFVSARLRPQGLPSTAMSDVQGSVSGSRLDRTVNLCAANPNSASALAVAQQVGTAMTVDRARFVGPSMGRRTYVKLISPATVAPAPKSHQLLNLGLRVFLGVLVALGAALVWDALDPTVRGQRDMEQALGAPVLASSS